MADERATTSAKSELWHVSLLHSPLLLFADADSRVHSGCHATR